MTKSVAWIFVSGALVATTACSVTTKPGEIDFKTQTKYTYPDETRTATSAWAGQAIRVENEGVNPNVNGDLKIIADGTDTITATGGIVAYADADDRASADLTAAEAIQSFTLTDDGSTITIHCGHGQDHGSSGAAGSGCLDLTVHIPNGSEAQAVNLTANSGNGPVDITGPVYGSANVSSTGSGDVRVALSPSVGSSSQIIGGDAVTLYVPATFSADTVQMGSKADPPAIDTTDFPDLVNGGSYGTKGAGAAVIKVGSTGILDSDVAALKRQ